MTIVVALAALLACIVYLTYTYMHEPSDLLFKPKSGGSSATQTQSEINEAAIEAWELAAMSAAADEVLLETPVKVKKAPKKISGAKTKKRTTKKPQARRKR